MPASQALFLWLFVATLGRTSPFETLSGRAIGDTCVAREGNGICQPTTECPGIFYNSLCPMDPADVKCCVNIYCSVENKAGYCRSVQNNGCSGGYFTPNYCPGPRDIQCCVKNDTEPTPPPGVDLGEKILTKAMEAEDTPYVWAGGDCNGPTDPDGTGTSGFDCSGLLSWAVCQVTGRSLFGERLRVTRDMYCASEERLEYKKIPYAEGRRGDAVFFGGECNCETNPEGIHHVGIMMDSTTWMWNALMTGTEVRADNYAIWAEQPCPTVIRF